MIMPTTLVLLSFPPEKRGQVMALVSLVIIFAPAIGPNLGGTLTEFLGWCVLFAIIAATALIIIVASRVVNTTHQFPTLPFDVPSVVLSSLGLVLLLYGIPRIASSNNSVLCFFLLIIGITALVLYGRRMGTQLRIILLRNKRYRLSVALIALVNTILVGSRY